MVDQEPTLFNLSIRENIAYGLDDEFVDEEQIKMAAKLANIHSFINSLPLVKLFSILIFMNIFFNLKFLKSNLNLFKRFLNNNKNRQKKAKRKITKYLGSWNFNVFSFQFTKKNYEDVYKINKFFK